MQVGDETPIHQFSEIWLEASDFLNLSCNYKLILASLCGVRNTCMHIQLHGV